MNLFHHLRMICQLSLIFWNVHILSLESPRVLRYAYLHPTHLHEVMYPKLVMVYKAGYMTSVSIGFSSDSFSSNPYVLKQHTLDGRCATNRYFQVLGNMNDIESYVAIDNVLSSYALIFLSHWGHLAIILMWVSASLFHIGWNGNYEVWKQNPIKTIPIAHSVCDPHFGLSDITNEIAYSGIYNWLYTLGFNSVSKHLYNFVIACELLAVASILLGSSVHLVYLDGFLHKLNSFSGFRYSLYASAYQCSISYIRRYLGRMNVHSYSILQTHYAFGCFKLFTACFDRVALRLNFHIGAMIGFFSIAWSAHLIHLAMPAIQGRYPFYTGNWASYIHKMDKDNHIWGGVNSASILTFFGGLRPDTMSLYLEDIAHHHLALGILLVVSAHLYSGYYKGLGHRIRDISSAARDIGTLIAHRSSSYHFQLSLACAALGVITSVVAQHTYSCTAYVYLSYDYVTTLALYVHHQYVASFLMVGALVHAGIFLVRDSVSSFGSAQVRMYIISHLSWVCLYLGIHTTGVYVHNDTVLAFGQAEKQILIDPVLYNMGPGDFLVYHAIGLGLHVTVLILLKGAVHARGSRLMPDKINFALSFACDGPTRGGTCDISAWDSAYLAFFWMLNTDAWIMFYFHWKHLSVWQNTVFQFDESSTYLNGWFRDYLWFNSAPLVSAYNAFSANDLSVVSWSFLGAHLCWAVGFMFLISWRGYWQELIDVVLVMHLKTPILYDLFHGGIYTPLALSIVQARFLGLSHFSVGLILTYATFAIGATS
mmetsp:Transcript_7316/g.18217  ORF Transcript_7316/g.18217 Transcript_7316/m.18217 type:complete len:765 (-) Transcript_7316:9-2303(-)